MRSSCEGLATAPILTSMIASHELKSMMVELTTQILTAFEGEKPLVSQHCSSGAKVTETSKGEFRTYHKGPSVHMTKQGDALEGIYDLPGESTRVQIF